VVIAPELAEVWVGHWQGKTYTELAEDPDAVRYAADPLAVKAARLRWCNGGPDKVCAVAAEAGGRHLRRIGTDKAATAYCDTMLAYYREHPATLAEQRVVMTERRANDIAARIGRTLDRQAPTRERMMASVLRARINTWGADSRQVEAAAKGYGMTVAEAVALVEEEYDVKVETA